MSTATKPRENSRLRILRAAAEVAAERGYEGTTISRICQRSGLPVSSVYWFYKDKDELLAEVVRHSFTEWIGEQPRWVKPPEGVSLLEGLRAILNSALGTMAEAPEYLRIGHMLALEHREIEPAGRALFLEIRAEVQQSIARWFAEELDDDLVERRPNLPQHLAEAIIVLSDGLFLADQIADSWRTEEYIDILLDIIGTAIETARAA
jgi:AcrR family transcriptional regulator